MNGSDGYSDVQPIDEPRRRFRDLLAQASGEAAPLRLVLSKYQGIEPDCCACRRGRWWFAASCLSFVYRYRSRDVTTNLPLPQALQRVDELLDGGFRQANLRSARSTPNSVSASAARRSAHQPAPNACSRRRRGRDQGCERSRTRSTRARAVPPMMRRRSGHLAHNREKRRLLSLERPFLQALGVTDSRAR